MVLFFASLLRLFLHAFSSKRTILSENALLEKENEIPLRRFGKERAHFSCYERFFLVGLNRAADVKDRLALFTPETVLPLQKSIRARTPP